ncbi:MAG: hypothetical protein KDA44_05055 [Planctomycetales bacterium]|nr:hypothetical protein [Planctomycetales bacterium]
MDTLGFESPRYNSGSLVGQPNQPEHSNWLVSGGRGGSATVQSAVTESGNQALRVDRGSFSDDRWLVPVDNYPTGRFVLVSWDMLVQESAGSGLGPFFGVDTYDDDETLGVLGSLGVDAKTGEILFQLGGSGFITGTGTFTGFNTWNHFGLLLDFDANAYRTYVNGTFLVQTGFVDLDKGVNEFTDADIAAFASAEDTTSLGMTGTAFFDNFLVTDGVLGDFDLDGDVDGADLATWESAYGVSAAGDATADGQTTGADFLVWQRQYGVNLFPATPVSSAVPEPAAIVLALLGVAALRRRGSGNHPR